MVQTRQFFYLIKKLIPLIVLLGVGIFNKAQGSKSPAKVLNIALNAHIASLDPAQSTCVYSADAVAQVYECLVEPHYLKPNQWVINLAASRPTISDNGLVYTFTIKKGVLFQDNICFPNGKGRELVAEDFVYTLKRVSDLKTKAPFFGLLIDKIKGLDAWRTKYADVGSEKYDIAIEGVKSLDKYTVQFVLNKPFPQFIHVLSMPFLGVVPREAVTYYGVNFLNNPVGTGPFIAKPFSTSSNKIIFSKNPTFREKYFPFAVGSAAQPTANYTNKRLPFLDQVIMHIMPEDTPCWLKFQKQDLAILDIRNSSVIGDVIQGGKLNPKYAKKGIKLFMQSRAVGGFLGFNCNIFPFKSNPKLRQAMSMAFDRGQYNKLLYYNTAIPAQSLIPPVLLDQTGYCNPYSTYNLDQAKELLKEAGYPNGKGLPDITLDTTANTASRQKGEFFAKCMANLGIKVKISTNIFPELLKRMREKKVMMYTIGLVASYPDAQSFFHPLWDPEELTFLCTDPTFNRYYEQAAILSDSPKRTKLYQELNKMAAELAPAIYTVHESYTILYHSWVKNYTKSEFHYGTAQYLDIDLTEKSKFK